MIEIEDLNVSFDQRPALEHVSLKIPSGQCVLVTGPTGCGKSTLANVLTGLIPHALPARMSGEVRVEGVVVASSTIAELACKIGIVFQNPSSQLFHLRVDDEVAFGPRNLGLPEADVQKRVNWSLDTVGLNGMHALKPSSLSGGQKQRLAIACALAMQPSVLILDEPTASLDVPGTRLLIATLEKIRREWGLTIVLIEHRLAEALRIADRTVILDRGHIIADGLPSQVFSDRRMLRMLGLRRPTEEPPVGWEALLEPNGPPPDGRDPVLAMHQVHAGYDAGEILQDIDIQLYPGEFVALVGENGAGKSTLGLVAAGLLKPSAGRIRFENGRSPRGGLDVALLFQNPSDQLLTDCVDDEVALGPLNYGQFQDELHLQTLEEMDLLELRQRQPCTLSAGQQQRTALAACLALRPKLVILDEPTLGQDWAHMEQLMDFMRSLNAQGTTVLLITHDYKVVHRYASRVILLEQGRIRLDGRLRRGEHD
ncbi:MAG: ABC transporter ATP-binding protein [Anaerolineales bacterium]